jgi:polysaccharide export outer membrane protein
MPSFLLITKYVEMKKSTWNSIALFVPICLLIFLLSCTSTRKAIYLNNIGDAEIARAVDDLDPVIQKNDLLSITISSLNTEASQYFNTSTENSTQILGYTITQATGYLVSQEGVLELPMLGKVKAAGLTKRQLKESITKDITDRQFLKNPVVIVRYLNYKVTVLGEVARPTVINVPDEKISLLEALGLAGDMTIYAKRDNVMVIREEEGKRVVKRLNLNSRDLFTSPYYYLKSNDIVYVEPNNAKISAASNTRGWLPVIISGLSLTAIVIDRLTR